MRKFIKSKALVVPVSIIYLIISLALITYISCNVKSIFTLIMQIIIVPLALAFLLELYYVITDDYKYIKDRWIIKIKSKHGTYSLLCNRDEYKDVLDTLKNSYDDEEFIFKRPHTVIRVRIKDIIEVKHYKLSYFRQLIEPILYILKNPVIIGANKYILLVGLMIIGVSKGLDSSIINILGSREGFNEITIDLKAVNVIFAIIYTLHITVSIVELLKEKEDDIGIWRTCTETESRSWINSYAVNALTISIISLALTSLNSLF